MNNSDRYKNELESVNTPEELINDSKTKVENIMYEKLKKKIFFNKKYLIPALCFASLLIVFAGFFMKNGNINLLSNSKNDKYLANQVITKEESEEEFNDFLNNSGMININEDSKFMVMIDLYSSKTDYSMYESTMKYISYMNRYRHVVRYTDKVKYDKSVAYDKLGINKDNYMFLLVDYRYKICIPNNITNSIIVIDEEQEQLTYYKLYVNDDTEFNTYALRTIRIALAKEMLEYNPGFQYYLDNHDGFEELVKVTEEQEVNNGEETEQPENNNTESQENVEPAIIPKTYGDVDRNGLIQARDVSLIKLHISGNKEITDSDAKKAADVNGDGLITGADATLLQYATVKAIEFDGSSPITSILYGDIDVDGKITQDDYDVIKKHVDGEIVLTNVNVADINIDGKVDGTDVFLIEGILNGTYDHSSLIQPLTNYIIYGDVDMNGKIQSVDVSKIRQYLKGSITLSEQQLKNADVNADGQVDESDATLIQEFVVKMHENTLPFKPIK